MGTMLTAVCDGCGATFGGLGLGAGMLTFRDHCAVPARCDRCRTVVSVDIMSDEPACPRCSGPVSSYAEEVVPTGLFASAQHQWRHPRHDDRFLVLPDTGSTCPACGQPTLTFHTAGFFD